MSDGDSNGKRDLIARVATLELLVEDLIHALWKVDPKGMDRMAQEASDDVDVQQPHVRLPLGEQAREQVYSVLETRRRMLRRKKADA